MDSPLISASDLTLRLTRNVPITESVGKLSSVGWGWATGRCVALGYLRSPAAALPRPWPTRARRSRSTCGVRRWGRGHGIGGARRPGERRRPSSGWADPRSASPIGVIHTGVGMPGDPSDAVRPRTAPHPHRVDRPPAVCARGILRGAARPTPPAPPRAPPPRADHAVPPGAAACGQLRRPYRGQHRRRVAPVHQGRIRRLPGLRHPGPTAS